MTNTKLPDKLPSSYALRRSRLWHTKKITDISEKLITNKKKEQKKKGEYIEDTTE
jgi:hypothetical protein